MVSHRLFAALAAVLLAACSGTPATSNNTDSTAAKSSQAPATFTEQEKDSMTQDEKVAIHNASVNEDNQVICRREVVTGSHRKKRVCRTSAQIKADQEQAQEVLKDRLRGNATGPTGGN